MTNVQDGWDIRDGVVHYLLQSYLNPMYTGKQVRQSLRLADISLTTVI